MESLVRALSIALSDRSRGAFLASGRHFRNGDNFPSRPRRKKARKKFVSLHLNKSSFVSLHLNKSPRSGFHAEKIRKRQLYFLVAEGKILRNSKAPTARRRTLAALRYGYAMERAVRGLSIELFHGSRGAFSANGWHF